ncbi:MAG: glycosyltransferase [Acidobacteria bacterium]|nr:glycosyltransferase [Acidobacteriota bacterium]
MKLLLIGPYPPPHGGISVHVAEAKKQLEQAGVCCAVLNLNRSAPESGQYISFRSSLDLLLVLLFYARRGWTFHLHTNGHNRKSWLLALACGLVGQLAPACLLTVHSGMAPVYLSQENVWQRFWRRRLARAACRLYDRVVAVNHQIREALASLGVSPDRLEVVPAYLSTTPPSALLATLPATLSATLSATVEELVRGGRPLLTTVLFYRPEYGFDLLVPALARLRYRYRNLRCLVMGSGEQQEEAERLIREVGMEDTVKLLGDLPHELCLALIAASDLFVRPTLKDADSISVREALSLGVHTVVSDVGHRPPGALLFRAGDRNDLVSTMEAALATPRWKRTSAAAQPASAPTSGNGTRRLFELYCRNENPSRDTERHIDVVQGAATESPIAISRLRIHPSRARKQAGKRNREPVPGVQR